jgi:tetratricopeptide (TPR) repeat protein
VTLAALLLAVSVLIASGRPAQPGFGTRYLAVAALGALAVVAALGLVGNRAAAAAARSTAHEQYARGAAAARRAVRWQPWSSRPWQLLGENQVQQGEFAAARASFEHAIAKDRQDWQLWLDLATAERGKAARRAALSRAQALNPRSIEIAAVRKALGL